MVWEIIGVMDVPGTTIILIGVATMTMPILQPNKCVVPVVVVR